MSSDLLKAVIVTFALGTAALQVGAVLPETPLETPIVLAAVALSIAAGVVMLVRKNVQPIVPIATFFIVTMASVLFLVDFVIAWYLGRVEM
jgi:hypothetical protein